jgi:16S rRNA (uracil1498-N3)-methyltransferase
MTQLQRLTIATSQLADGHIGLTASQQHYLGRVLRLRAGDRFIAMDGQDCWLAELQADPAMALLLDKMLATTELPVAVTLLIALPKTGMEDLVRQVTEIGVRRIVPILSQRTILNPSPQKQARWLKIAQEAAEQSERQFIPEILPPRSWTTALASEAQQPTYICEARGQHPHLLQVLTPPFPSALTLAIGPEGGWTETELEQSVSAGYQPVSLGARILRAVTAPLVAMSLVAAAVEAVVPAVVPKD